MKLTTSSVGGGVYRGGLQNALNDGSVAPAVSTDSATIESSADSIDC